MDPVLYILGRNSPGQSAEVNEVPVRVGEDAREMSRQISLVLLLSRWDASNINQTATELFVPIQNHNAPSTTAVELAPRGFSRTRSWGTAMV